MKFIYVDTESAYYKEAVTIRKERFFKGMENSSSLINDALETKGIHLVCLYKDEVVGAGRLNIEGEKGIISQMAIKTGYQRQGIGASILKVLIQYSKEKQAHRIELSARETALEFYKKYGFVPIEDKYPSKKTGIIHQKMTFKI